MIIPDIKLAKSSYEESSQVNGEDISVDVPNVEPIENIDTNTSENTGVPQVQPAEKSPDVNEAPLDNHVQQQQDQKDFEPMISPEEGLGAYSNIENVLPPEVYKSLPTAEQALRNELPENYEQVVNEFYPYITDYNVFNSSFDISFDALYYLGLGGLGGKYVTWVLGREHLDEHTKHKLDYRECNCDANAGKTFDIGAVLNEAISYANEKGFDPPAPLFGMARHVGCTCHFEFNKNVNFSSPESISNDCPGVPKTNDINAINQAKRAIWDKIPETVYISSRTFPPLHITQKTAMKYHKDIKFASAPNSSIASNRPIKIKENCLAFMDFGMWTPIKEGTLGFVLDISGPLAKVFLSSNPYILNIKTSFFDIIEGLTENPNLSLKETYFVMAEGKMGLLCNKRNGKYYVYFPQQREIRPVYEIQALSEVSK
jgi:hypothetical protein